MFYPSEDISTVDGARLFNAAVSLKCSLKEMTRDVGVDILSVGGTKIGLLFGEAVVFFGNKYSQNLRYRQKQSMQLPSKMRFMSAQFQRLLQDEIWVKSATHANEMAKRLFEGVKDIQKIKITKTVQANSVFAIIPVEWNELLQEQTPFHIWNENTNEVRWMCAFDTEEKDVDEFISLMRKLDNI
jgi:threonine aldolase